MSTEVQQGFPEELETSIAASLNTLYEATQKRSGCVQGTSQKAQKLASTNFKLSDHFISEAMNRSLNDKRSNQVMKVLSGKADQSNSTIWRSAARYIPQTGTTATHQLEILIWGTDPSGEVSESFTHLPVDD